MSHNLCDECTTASHCMKSGCIPITAEHRPSLLASRWFWIAALVSSLLWVLADVLLSVYWPH